MLSRRIKTRRIFKGHGECVIVTEYWDDMTTQEYFGKKGYKKIREHINDFGYDRWTGNGYTEVKTLERSQTDPYNCPNCGYSPLQVSNVKIEADVTDDCLYCGGCGKNFEIEPGKEII
jgi:hypothetical protein